MELTNWAGGEGGVGGGGRNLAFSEFTDAIQWGWTLLSMI